MELGKLSVWASPVGEVTPTPLLLHLAPDRGSLLG